MSEPTSKQLVDQYLAGQAQAATALFDRYVQRLLALARSRVGARLQRRVDPEDIVQSAYRSFFVHAQNGEYQLAHAGDLWRLLASTTLNKLYGQIEKHTAEKRGMHLETQSEDPLAGLAIREPAVVDIVAIAEQLALILGELSQGERFVLEATLRGQSIEAISREMGKSDRTVRRFLESARKRFEDRLLGQDGRTKAKPSRSREPLAPLQFSDYVLHQLLGAGGMGKVYRATDKRSGETVALKALHKFRQLDERAVTQFVQEAQILAGLSHPNIVGAKGLGRFPAGGYFIVMDFVAGANLQSRIAAGPLPVIEAVSIVKLVTSAIQYAHQRGIVHCDLKPANVLADSEGRVFVADFGFAFILDAAPDRFASNLGGTQGFIAPEVLKLRSKPSPKSDIYAIGALLWTLFTGAQPEGTISLENASTLQEALTSICRRCLADNPDDRFQTAGDLGNALQRLDLPQLRFTES
jgi:RNA polymerase sigma factor (sigma-70 family)